MMDGNDNPKKSRCGGADISSAYDSIFMLFVDAKASASPAHYQKSIS
jgi:hypothetical protein